MNLVCPNCFTRSRARTQIPDGAAVRCPGCQQRFAAPGLLTAEAVPAWDEDFDPIPAAKPAPVRGPVFPPSPPPLSSPTKPCPFCAEDIKVEAKKCRHCGETLDPLLRSAQEANRLAAANAHRPGSSSSPGIAMVLSFFWPGLGQIYRGRAVAGICWMLATVLGYCMLIIPGLILHLCCVISAGSGGIAD